MRYCGVGVTGGFQQLCVLREVRASEPPIRLEATFYEPGPLDGVLATLDRVGEAAIAIAAPQSRAGTVGTPRVCDAELAARGVPPQGLEETGLALFAALEGRGVFRPAEAEAEAGGVTGVVGDGAFRSAGVFETNVEGVFCALQGTRVPARRHPLGVARRVQELIDDHLLDPGGDLWFRRIEELEAAAAALAAHRYAVGHACWVGDPGEAVIVLPGSRVPKRFSMDGVLPPVTRLTLGEAPPDDAD